MTPDDVLILLRVFPHAVGTALRTLAARQTPQEQRAGFTKELNGVGFNAFDAPYLQPLADKLARGDVLIESDIRLARSRLAKYAAQLAASGALDHMHQEITTQITTDPFAAAAVAVADAANRRRK